MKDAKDFPYPLDTDIEEQIPVRKITVDSIDEEKKTATFSMKTVMEKRITRYMNVEPVKFRCKPGEHVFRVYNAKKWMFACIHCPFVRKVYPSTYRFEKETGKLIHLVTQRAV